jgi:uncharacterized membrane protein
VNSRNSLRHHQAHADLHGAFGKDRFGVAAEKFARFFGTPKFIFGQTLFVIAWVTLNTAVALTGHWDSYPFILLNLLFSTQAAYAAPLILLAQTRQAARDKASEEASAKHREELASVQQVQLLVNTSLTKKIHSMQVQQMRILAIVEGSGGHSGDQGGTGGTGSG